VKITDLPDDLFAQVLELWQETGLTRPWNDPDADLQRAMAGNTSTILVARDDPGSLLGTAMVGHDGHRGWVYYLAVQPSHQRQGLARALMSACEDWVRERGVLKIQLMVRHSNQDVIAFYNALGYVDGEVVVLGRFLDR
jgi:ribosomal protein S18 acetylase RimI-like enzyme